ncbi:hypothetical protein CRV01_02810 [Arcobacter sp. CECT 8983]|uniref:tetratricopeptide repeat protein n=1 Tax=Arcobacter sp. CECT 8983 TaxID=2044508 RepID=UPI00100A31D7|nr:CDC27 family protein [Arcobacter sp. CECT 8983]RXJ91228.1 hypothetical protein CRV01_02810 [Arcobacter sp. CECT 8983]
MKHIILLVLIVFGTLFAQDESKKATTVETSNEFILAKTHYKVGDYTQSYFDFKKLFLKYSDNVQVNYYLAMSATKLKLYDEATAAFERVLIVAPEYHRARLEYARVQYILGFKEEAKKEFLKVAQYPIPINVRKNIEMYLSKIDSLENNSTFISLGFGYMYDDNINNGIEYDSYNLPGFFNLELNGEEPQSSTSFLTFFQVDHIQSLSKNSPWSIKHTGVMLYKNQTENDFYNFSYYAYTPTLFYNDVKNKSEYSLQVGMEKIYPGDRVDFTVYSIEPKYRLLLNKNTIVSTYLKYNEFHYEEQVDKNKSYSKKVIGGSIKYKDFQYILQFEKDDRDFGDRTDLNKNIVSNTFLYQYKIEPSLFLNLKYEHKQTRYNDKDVFFDNNRKDNTNVYSAGLTKIINKKDFLTFNYTKTDNSTNQEAYDYNKNAVSMNYTWRFKL